jgi:type IV pilus assembly protein PilM
MFDWLWGKKSGAQLGIDLGSYSIKIVELTKKEERAYLTNYALAQKKSEAAFNISELKDEEIAKILVELISKSQLASRRASVSLPVEKTFSTVINLPFMTEQELAAAVPYEAQKYVPLPLDEVILDWSVISSEKSSVKPSAKGATDSVKENSTDGTKETEGGQIQILLLAVPKEIINRITRIIKLAGLELVALEQEAFSLARSLVGNDKSTYIIVDLGRKGADLIIVDQGFIRMSHNLESTNKEIILMEIDRVVNVFQIRYNKKVGQCLLAGGRAIEKDLFDFLSSKLKIPVKVGDPFARIDCDAKLEPFLKELGSQLAIAVGLAMRSAD